MERLTSHVFLSAASIPKKLQTGLAIFMLLGLAGASVTALNERLNSESQTQTERLTAEADSEDERR
jgi:hypothetical protein